MVLVSLRGETVFINLESSSQSRTAQAMEALGYTETFDAPTPPNSVDRFDLSIFLLIACPPPPPRFQSTPQII